MQKKIKIDFLTFYILMSGTNYNQQLNALNSQFISLLDDFKKNYISSNQNPDNEDYANAFSQNISDIQNVNSKVFQITAELESDLTGLMDDLNKITSQTEEQKVLNAELQEKIQVVIGNAAGNVKTSGVMINNYKEIYTSQYIQNVTHFFGIFLAIYVIFKVYSNK
jgi:activator of 2-hydroxyglutaryl-CoA dehydratase